MHYTPKIYYGDSLPPPLPLYTAGDLFVERANNQLYMHDGTDWVIVGTDPTVSNFDTYDDLRNASTPDSPIILIGGRQTAGDGGQGFFIRDPLNRADNDGTVLVDADGQSWQRVFIGDVFAVWFYGKTSVQFDGSTMNDFIQMIRDYHGRVSVDWTEVSWTVSGSYEWEVNGSLTFKNLTVDIPSIYNELSWAGGDGEQIFLTGFSGTGSGTHHFGASGDGSIMIVNSHIQRAYISDGASVDVSILGTRSTVTGRGVVRSSVFLGYDHSIGGNAMVSGCYFYNYRPPSGGTVTISDNAFVVGNRFYTYLPDGPASGTVFITGSSNVVFVANHVELYRYTYPYPFTMTNPRRVFVSGNTFISNTGGGQDSMQLTFTADAEATSVVNNLFVNLGGSGNYGVRIRGGAKANMVLANNSFFNFGGTGGSGIERRDGVGNIKAIGNIFYNWARGIYKYDSTAINGVFEGNSNAFSNCGTGVADADYVNSTADTVWS